MPHLIPDSANQQIRSNISFFNKNMLQIKQEIKLYSQLAVVIISLYGKRLIPSRGTSMAADFFTLFSRQTLQSK